MAALITLNALFARLAARLVEVARARTIALDPATPFAAIEEAALDLTTPFTTDVALRGPGGTWIEGPFVRDAGTLEVRW